MASSEYIGFQCDYSDNGTLEVNMDVQSKTKRKPAGSRGSKPSSEPDLEEVTLLVPLWLALGVNTDGEEEPIEGTHFVSCRTKGSIEIFIEKTEFEKRLPKKWPARKDVYEADWEQAKKSDSFDCVGYDDDGLVLGSKGARAWPRAGLIAPAKGSEIDRYYFQAAIWQEIVTTSTSAGSSRLWKPSSWNEPPLKIYLAPCNAWPSFDQLRKIAEKIKQEENDKQNNKSSRRLGLTQWLDWEVPTDESAVKDLVLLSTNLLRLYNTYISLDDLQRLVRAQTQGSPNWKRPWPEKAVAEVVQAQMLDNLKVHPKYHALLSGGLKKSSTTWISSAKTFGIRIDANKIMGSKSANQLGKEWWKSGDVPKVVAEWLHRSAYSLGPLNGNSDFQSPDNIVFGTFEANSDMTRAETSIRTLRDVSGAKGTLTTIVTNTNLPDNDENRLSYLDPVSGKAEAWEIGDWIGEANYTWIAPNLVYKGDMTISDHMVPIPWATSFHTFSRYSPLMLEGKLDTRVVSEYLRTNYPSSGPTTAKRSKTGLPATLAVPSTSSTPMLATSSSLGTTAPARVPRSVTMDATPFADSNSSLGQPAQSNGLITITSNMSSGPGFASCQSTGLFNDQNLDATPIHPTTHTAWRSIRKNAKHVTIGDVRIEKPHLANDGNDLEDTTPAPPVTGFMLEGTISLFGLHSHRVALQSWHGPPPPDVEVGVDVPIYQRVQLGSIHPSEFIPLLESTPFSEFEFKNVTITYQNYQFVKTHPLGWTIAADISIDRRHGTLNKILRDVLKLSDSSLQLRVLVSLGLGHTWQSRLRVSTFAIRGLLQMHPNDINNQVPEGIPLCDDVMLSRVGVLFYGISVPDFGLSHKETMNYGFKLFGDMHIKVPGSVTPLELDFEIGEFAGVVGLEAAVKGNVWKNAFGVGIDLEMVRLSATFEPTSPLKSLDCMLSAYLRAESASAFVTGTYTAGGGYSASAFVQNLGCQGVADLFRHYTGDELVLPNHIDVLIGSASIEISKEKGLLITVDKLEFDHYTASSATIELSSSRVLVQASLDKIVLPGELGVNLVSAYMRVSFEKQGSGKSTDVALGGTIQLDGINVPAISAGVHLYKLSPSEKLEWTVYGTFTELGNTTTLGQLFPDVRETFLADFALQDLMFIAASKDDPSLSQLNHQKYPVKKGVQFSARLDQVGPLNKLLRRSSFPGLLLDAVWVPDESFLLNVVLPTNTLIHLGHGISTDPITLSINTRQLLLQIATGVTIPVAPPSKTLDFQAALTIKGEAVKLEGQMHGRWVNPFGISPSVAIGPFLELGVAIDLAIFPETGLPTSFSFAGGLTVGETEGQVAVQISENPSQELLSGEIKHFGIRDLVAFTREITNTHIPIPPDFIDFQDIKLYISSGVTLGTVIYPAGFSFNAALIIFGARIHASAQVSSGILQASGSIDNLTVGPLRITGQQRKQATLDLRIGSTVQQLKVDGAIEFLGAYIGLTLNLEILPRPTFWFNFTLHFTDLLTFLVDARMIGDDVDLKDLTKLNFSLHALFEQHLIEHIRDQLVASLEALKHRTDDAIKDAEVKVQQEEQHVQAGIASAQNELDNKYKLWIQHSNKVHADSQVFIDRYMKELRGFQTKVDDARKSFNASLKQAEGNVQHANAKRAAEMRAAEAKVAHTKSKWDLDVAEAETKLEAAKKYMQQKFGSAEADIEAAKHKVDEVQGEINSTNDRIHYCENSPWYRFDLKAELVYQGPKLLVLEGYKYTADSILDLAEDVVKGVDYLDAKAAIPAAEVLVKVAGTTGDAAFRFAQATVQETDRLTAGAVRLAEAALESVQKTGDALIRKEESALQWFVDSQKDLLYAAQHAVDELVYSAEWLAYQTASGALSVASHATHTLDIAKKALEAARKAVDGTITITEEAVVAALSALDITKIELGATLDTFQGGQGSHFEAAVEGEIVGRTFSLNMSLNMRDTAQFIDDVFHELIKLL
ncbi:hypothetical protein FRC12_001190 [Ceratobasidium sp. 428]|nr:hypothetical protein FRC12_001190 [Ceratobasidium sp. 428]